jgi:hypothetical protein
VDARLAPPAPPPHIYHYVEDSVRQAPAVLQAPVGATAFAAAYREGHD